MPKCPIPNYQFPKATFIESAISIRFVLLFSGKQSNPSKMSNTVNICRLYTNKNEHMFISDHIFKFHNLFYKQVALLISYRSAQTSENILQNRNQRQITVSFNRYYMKMVIFWRNKKGELRLYQLAWTNSLLNKSHMVDYLVFHLSFLIFWVFLQVPESFVFLVIWD